VVGFGIKTPERAASVAKIEQTVTQTQQTVDLVKQTTDTVAKKTEEIASNQPPAIRVRG